MRTSARRLQLQAKVRRLRRQGPDARHSRSAEAATASSPPQVVPQLLVQPRRRRPHPLAVREVQGRQAREQPPWRVLQAPLQQLHRVDIGIRIFCRLVLVAWYHESSAHVADGFSQAVNTALFCSSGTALENRPRCRKRDRFLLDANNGCNTVSTVSTEDMPGANHAQAATTNTASRKAFRLHMPRPPSPSATAARPFRWKHNHSALKTDIFVSLLLRISSLLPTTGAGRQMTLGRPCWRAAARRTRPGRRGSSRTG